MQIKIQPMGTHQTNCYIVTVEVDKITRDIIIDPGLGATKWVVENCINPIAILNTHGHFDHVWSNAELKEILKIPIYVPKGDAFMLEKDPFGQGTPPSKPDYLVDGDETVDIEGVEIKFRHFPGHTPGCSIIEIGDVWFSGDFLFQQSIGRWDFPYSSGADMVASLQRASKITDDFTLYPGHGLSTTLKTEQRIMNYWIKQVESTI
ncbi:Hydroxyacylglutathione hydrolase [hydrothermal vent metagenome]|uniref:Hydroxyacylglutathione hydrolase n=1 Tax=hydrothermal vent metagenome TaxID=652676 RepID=A0A1W1C9Q9_9ZZZZ